MQVMSQQIQAKKNTTAPKKTEHSSGRFYKENSINGVHN